MEPDPLVNTHTSNGSLSEQLKHCISYKNPAELKPNPRNARKHSKKQRAQIAASIRAHGFINPIITDPHGNVLAGHGRLEAALELGLSLVPTISLDHLSKEQLRAYALADNKLAELSEWDKGTRKISEIEYWLNDGDPRIKVFAEKYIHSLRQQVEAENKRANEDIILRKHQYGSDSD